MIEKYDISLMIMGNDIAPHIITKELNVMPEIIHVKGETRNIGNLKWKEDIWCKDFNSDGLDFEQSLRNVLQFIKINRKKFKEYQERAFRMDIFCGIWYDDKTDKIFLPIDLVKEFEKVGIEITLDEYWLKKHL